MNPRELYVDLLIRIIANTIYEDPSMEPGRENAAFDPKLRGTGSDWPRLAHSMAGIERLRNTAKLVQRTIDERVPGHYIETGVWRGGSSILMRGVLAANGIADRRVYVADSFEGLPQPNVERFEADKDDILYSFPQLAVSLEQVKANFDKYGLLDEQVVFVEGYFEHTLHKLDAKPFALLRLDGDMYQSTIEALEALYPRLSPGGYVIIDDYGAYASCRKAVHDYRGKHGIEAPLIQIDWTGWWWRKPSQPASAQKLGAHHTVEQ